MEDLQIEFPVEYYRYKVYQLLPWLLQPAIDQEFANWNPLEVSMEEWMERKKYKFEIMI